MTPHSRSDAVRRIAGSSLRPMGAAAPEGSVSLAMGEPDFETPAVIQESLRTALSQGFTHYGDLNGDPELRLALAEMASAQSASNLSAQQVSVTHGATGALSAAIMALVSPGDRVVIPEPTYSLYQDLVQLVGGEVVNVPLRDNHQLDVPAVTDALTDAKLVILCNPGNPSGAVLAPQALHALAKGLGQETYVLVDEAYSRILYSDDFVSALSIAPWQDRLIYVNTFSKTYAMTGFRLGYSIAPKELARDISLIHRTVNGAVNAAVQRAGLTALAHAESAVTRMVSAYRERREIILSLLDRVPGIEFERPDGAFYVFLKHGLSSSSNRITTLARQRGLLVRSGLEYGASGEGYLRLSFAASPSSIAKGVSLLNTLMTEEHTALSL